MAVPFGFSAGDFMAAIHLAHKVSTALRETDGASSEFTQSILQLDCLERLLRNAQIVYSANVPAQQLDLLRILARECYILLNKFLSRIKVLEPSLGNFVLGNNRIINKTERVVRKVQWGLQLRKELSDLIVAIGPRMEAINMQLLFIVIECQQKTGSSVDILSQTLNDLNSQMRNFQKSLDTRIDSLATIMSMENVSQNLQDMKSEVTNYHNLQIDAISKRVVVQGGCLDLGTSQQVLDAIQSLTCKKEDDQDWSGTNTVQIAASLDPEFNPCSTDHSETTCDDQGRIKKIEDQLADQNQQLQLLVGMIGELQSSVSRPKENPGVITQDTQEIIQHAIQALLEFFRTAANDLLLKLWIVLPLAQRIFRILQAPRLLVSLTIRDSIMFEDVLGRVVHLPYIYFRHYPVFIERLRCEFEGKPGKDEVFMNQFRIFRHGRCNQFLTQKNWDDAVRPGSRIAMSIVLKRHQDRTNECPRCQTTENAGERDGLRQCTTCELSWALQKLDSPHQPSPKPAIQGVTSSPPLPTKMQNMEEDEHSSPSMPLPGPSGVSLHSSDDKDIEKFRIVHIQKGDLSVSVASYLERIGFSLHGSFPWKTNFKPNLMTVLQQGPSQRALEREKYGQSICIFWCKGSPKFTRISTTHNIHARHKVLLRYWGQNFEYDPNLDDGREMRLSFTKHLERLIYAELSDYALRVKSHKRSVIHYKFFFVSKDHAIRVFQKWKNWMLQDPYMQNSDGQWKLKPFFAHRIEEMCRPLPVDY